MAALRDIFREVREPDLKEELKKNKLDHLDWEQHPEVNGNVWLTDRPGDRVTMTKDGQQKTDNKTETDRDEHGRYFFC